MIRRPIVTLLVCAPALAVAQPTDPDTIDADEVYSSWSDDVRPLQKSYSIPFAETLAFELGLNLGAQLSGFEWADISMSSIKTNLTSPWVWDEDSFTINNFGHPYGGAWPFLAARSMGHGFWVSSAYAFGGSLIWEALMESEKPSLNDQITTTIGGALLGESLHRVARALRHRPSKLRQVAASVLDPVAAFNRGVFGKAWRDKLPPSYYAHFGIGWEQLSRTLSGAREDADQNQLHAELVLQHGMPGDQDFRPRVPLDHFDLRASIDVSREHVVGAIDIRGMLYGSWLSSGALRGIYGLYGTYDYMNPDRVRASSIGIGPGIATETALGEHSFLRATAVVSLVPWGAAGGSNESETMRDYQRGPGLAEILELELGRRGWGEIRVTSRAWQIDGTQTGDGREFVSTHTLGGRLALTKHQAFGVESTLSVRDSRFEVMDARDKTLEIRAFYAVTSSD
jgi:hypothetical protein